MHAGWVVAMLMLPHFNHHPMETLAQARSITHSRPPRPPTHKTYEETLKGKEKISCIWSPTPPYPQTLPPCCPPLPPTHEQTPMMREKQSCIWSVPGMKATGR